MEPLAEAVGHLLKVKRNPAGVQTDQDWCNEVETKGGTHVDDADLYVYVTGSSDRSRHLVVGYNCGLDLGSFRSVTG